NVTVDKAAWRHTLAGAQSGKCVAAYLLASAGQGESTTDLAWDGQCVIYDNARLVAESERFAAEPQLVLADVDLERLVADRLRLTSFIDQATDERARITALRDVPFTSSPRIAPLRLARIPEATPFVPTDAARRDERCREVYNIQVTSLAQR